jgi:hypothetical protein
MEKLLSKCVLAAFPALVAGACSGPTPGDSLVQVDQLVESIGRVHTGTELAQERMRAATDELATLVALDFGGDPVQAYARFASAAKASGQQFESLKMEVQKMKGLADPVFKRWAADLDTFSNLQLRLASQNRLSATRKRYEAVLHAIEPAQSAFEIFNQQLGDYVVYLKNDLNSGSLGAIREDALALQVSADSVHQQFEVCQEAAQEYVASVSLPTVAQPAPAPAVEAAPAPAKKPAGRNGRSGRASSGENGNASSTRPASRADG